MPATASRIVRLAEIHDAITSLDEVIALAVKAGEVAQIASLETNSRRLLESTWNTLAKEATSAAAEKVQAGASEEVVGAAIDERMEQWAEIVGPRFAANATRIYQLARLAGKKRAEGKYEKPLVYDTTRPNTLKVEAGSIVIVVEIPSPIADKWPSARGGEDESPPHFTALYIPEGRERYAQAVEIVRKTLADHQSFKMKLAPGVQWFETDSKDVDPGERWIASKGLTFGAAELALLHWQLVAAFKRAGFKPSVRDDFKPHATLKYCPSKGAYVGPVPEGSFLVAGVKVWGGKDQSTPVYFGERAKAYVRKAPIDPSVVGAFDTTDAEAIKILKRNNLFWIGEHYEKNVKLAIRRTVREVMLQQGGDKAAAARVLRDLLAKKFKEVAIPSGWRGTQSAYLEALSANAATTARAQGQLRSFAKAGFSYYEIVNPSDARTCEICVHMNGKIFKTTEGADLADAVIKATTPSEVRGIHPWMGYKAMKKISPTSGRAGRGETAKLAGAGFSLPPFHYRCRCVVDVTDEAPRGDGAEEL